MTHVNFLIIGGGIAGTTAAETIRAEDKNASILILEYESHPLYSRVQIPYYLKNIKKREDIFLRSFQDYSDKNISYLTGVEATSLDVTNKTVVATNGETYSYDKLLITTGGAAKKLNKYPNEHAMQTIEDADKIYADVQISKKGVVIGSGFIALEMLEVFVFHKLEAYLCVNANGFWSSFLAKELSDVILSVLERRGIHVHRGTTPSIVGEEGTIVGTGIGLDVGNKLFQNSGLDFDAGLKANEYLETNVSNVYTAGDVAKFYSQKLQRHVRYGNWTNALISGKTAGFNMLGKKQVFDNLSSYSVKPEGLAIVFLGFAGIDDQTIVRTEVYSETECAQFFVRNGKLDGCVLINRTQDRPKFQALIESRQAF